MSNYEDVQQAAYLAVVNFGPDDDIDETLGVDAAYATLDDEGARTFAATVDIVRTTVEMLKARIAILRERKRMLAEEIATLVDEIDRAERMLRDATAPRQTRPRRATSQLPSA